MIILRKKDFILVFKLILILCNKLYYPFRGFSWIFWVNFQIKGKVKTHDYRLVNLKLNTIILSKTITVLTYSHLYILTSKLCMGDCFCFCLFGCRSNLEHPLTILIGELGRTMEMFLAWIYISKYFDFYWEKSRQSWMPKS